MNRTGCRSIAGCHYLIAVCCVLLASLLLSSGAADAADRPQAEDGLPSKIIWVDAADRDQFTWLIEQVGATPLACIPGPGLKRYHVSPAQLDQIADADLPHVIIVDDAEAAFQAERARVQQNRDARGANWFDDYKTNADINAKLDEYVANFPNLVTKVNIGTSHEGRAIYALEITGPGSDKPGVLFNGCQHAREWVSPMTCMWIADQLLSRYATDPDIQQLVDDVRFHIVPMVNPDGYVYTHNDFRLWRKNRRDNGDGTFGVDLNRNWDIHWNGGDSTSTNTSSDIYVGPAPFSEPESQALRDYVLANPGIVAHIDFHSYSQLLLEPWAHTTVPPDNNDEIESLSSAMAGAIQAVHGTFYEAGNAGEILYAVDGSASDWVHDQGAFGFAVELRDTGFYGFELPPDQIIPTGEENFAGVVEMAQWAREPLNVTFPNGRPDRLSPNQPTTLTVDITPRFDDTLQPSTAVLLTRTTARGAFTETPLAHLGGTSYEATLPAAACGSTLEYYIQIDDASGAALSEPFNAPDELFSAEVISVAVVVEDDFETNDGWTTANLGATTGEWQRGVPVDDTGWTYDPAADGDGSGQCWLTENELGNTDIDLGAVVLTSPVFDMSGSNVADQWTVTYFYYLYITGNSDGSDRLLVEATDGSGVWTTVAVHDTSGGTQWRSHSISGQELANAGLAFTADMQFRFTANDDGDQNIVEAGLDGFTIARFGCDDAIVGDIAAPFGVVDVFDLLELLANWGADGPGADIAEPNDVVDVFDLLALLANWG